MHHRQTHPEPLKALLALVPAFLKRAGAGPAFEALRPWLMCSAPDPQRAHHAYGRNVLFADASLEIMIAKWRQDQECLPHDHGNSTGRVVILAGAFTEFDFGWRERNFQKIDSQRIRAGDVLDVHPAQTHSMVCGTADGYTLHIYTPPIREMKVFSTAERCTYVVRDDCGAWQPQPHQVIAREEWRS